MCEFSTNFLNHSFLVSICIPQKDGSPSYVNFQYIDDLMPDSNLWTPGLVQDGITGPISAPTIPDTQPQCFKKSNIVTKGLTTIIHPICLQMLIGFEGASVQILLWPAYSPPADPCESGCKSGTKLCERSQVVITAHDSTCSRWSCHFDPNIKFCEKITKITGPKYPKTPNRAMDLFWLTLRNILKRGKPRKIATGILFSTKPPSMMSPNCSAILSCLYFSSSFMSSRVAPPGTTRATSVL